MTCFFGRTHVILQMDAAQSQDLRDRLATPDVYHEAPAPVET